MRSEETTNKGSKAKSKVKREGGEGEREEGGRGGRGGGER
jgi:hypothetical protein